jgi:hypothetical protein
MKASRSKKTNVTHLLQQYYKSLSNSILSLNYLLISGRTIAIFMKFTLKDVKCDKLNLHDS